MTLDENEIVYEAFNPWRRFFARGFDIAIYKLVWRVLFMQLFSMNVLIWERLSTAFFDIVVVFIMVLFLEPLMLSKFGTTPGKKILGLEIRGIDGERLDYGKAFDRTLGVLCLGMGYNIPVYQLIRYYKSYQILEEKNRVSWDENIQYKVLDMKWYRGIGIILGYGLMILIIVTSAKFSAFPPNRGEITVAEYAENYNFLIKHYGFSESNYYLDSKGAWEKRVEKSNNGTVHIISSRIKLPEINYETENHYLKSLSFELEVVPEDGIITGPLERSTVGILAFVLADDSIKPWMFDTKEVLEPVKSGLFKMYNVQVGQTTISNHVKSEGYKGSSDNFLLYKMDHVEDGYYYMSVEVER